MTVVPKRGHPGGEQLPDPAEPDHADGLVGDLHAGELAPLPLPRAHRGVRGRDHPGDGEQQRQRVFGGGDDVRLRRVDHQHAAGGGGRYVDVVQPDAGPGHHLEHRRRGQRLGVHRGRGPDQDRVGVLQGGQQGAAVGAVHVPDLEFRAEHVHRGLGELLGDQHDGLGHSDSSPWVGRWAPFGAGGHRPGVSDRCVGRGRDQLFRPGRNESDARRTMLAVPGRAPNRPSPAVGRSVYRPARSGGR